MSTSTTNSLRRMSNELLKMNKNSKENKFSLKTPKGTKDFSPYEMSIRNFIFHTITSIFRLHGGVTIDTPVFELKEILSGKYGEDSKLIYDLKDQGGELTSLRYDLTVPFARYLAMNKSNFPSIKRYHIAKVYRRDQPAIQKGRMREFYQCDFDIAGSFDPMIPDSEILHILSKSLLKLDVGPFTIKLNHRSILDGIFELCGVPQDKIRSISSAVDKLDKSPWEEVKKEMTNEKGLDESVADKIGKYVKLHGGKDLLDTLKSDNDLMSNQKAKNGVEQIELLFSYLDILDVTKFISFDLSLARGLDYYTGVIYEAVVESSKPTVNTSNGKEEQVIGVGSIAAGGRYDNLVGMFAGDKPNDQIPCVGVSIGVERVFSILMEKFKNQDTFRARETEVYIMSLGDGLLNQRMQVAKKLWDNNIKTEFLYKVKPKLPKQFEVMDKEKIPFGLLLAPKEWNDGYVRIKEQRGKDQQSNNNGDLVKIDDLVDELTKRIDDWKVKGGF